MCLSTKSANQGGVHLQQLVRLCSHDELVFVQTLDLMRPPIDGCSPVFRDDQEMMVFFLSYCINLVREFQCLGNANALLHSTGVSRPVDVLRHCRGLPGSTNLQSGGG